MIHQADEFVFITGEAIDADHPHGDLDRIDLTENVLPERMEPFGIYGIDVAIMLEGVYERDAAPSNQNEPSMPPTANRKFTRKLSHSQVLFIARTLVSLMDSGRWVQNPWLIEEKWIDESSDDLGNIFPEVIMNSEQFRSMDELLNGAENVKISSSLTANMLYNSDLFVQYWISSGPSGGNGFPALKWSSAYDDYAISYLLRQFVSLAGVPTVFHHAAIGVTEDSQTGDECDHMLKSHRVSWDVKFDDGGDLLILFVLNVTASRKSALDSDSFDRDFVVVVDNRSHELDMKVVADRSSEILGAAGIELVHVGDGEKDKPAISQSVSIMVRRTFILPYLRYKTRWHSV